MTALGLDGWWEEPYYKLCYTANLRGEFILAKLEQREPETFRTVMADIYRGREPMPESRGDRRRAGADGAAVAGIPAQTGDY
jgi:hypothetical protein